MRRSPQHGFTLLELMVVVVLIGIIVTVVVQSVGDGGRREHIKQEANRLSALVELVGEEAVLKSSVIGLRFDEQGYTFLRFAEKDWNEVAGDDLLKPRKFGENMEIELLVEGMSVGIKPDSALGSEDEAEERKPQVVFLPSGERTPFELSLRYEDDESGYLLNVPPLGSVEMSRLEGEAG